MKSFLLAMVAMVVISYAASIGLQTFDMSAEKMNSTSNVRLN